MLSIVHQPEAHRIVFKFEGRFDMHACQGLNDEIDRAWENIKASPASESTMTPEIVFNLENVSFISSAFIRLCTIAAKKVDPGKFSVINCDPLIKKTFKIAGLNERLNVQ